MEIMKQKLSHGAKMIKLGNQAKIFRKTFGIREGEKVLLASQCYLYTTAGAIAGILFISTERVAFCSDRSIKTYSTTGELLKFQYKFSFIELISYDMAMEKQYPKSLLYHCFTTHSEARFFLRDLHVLIRSVNSSSSGFRSASDTWSLSRGYEIPLDEFLPCEDIIRSARIKGDLVLFEFLLVTLVRSAFFCSSDD
ncbi:hypothetical protein L2E82_42391 [Cichorium intybus]|uniref:Uncharacterized protein n=1 Tax=Cichorium intybus TaxID=13427 RepID=A0ACB8ZM00_CICIN|nr:hypothetical protein L2E82_42391 [Cichorium intybus]